MKGLTLLMLVCAAISAHAQETLSIEQVAADRALWPREVTVNVPLKVPIMINGKSSGAMDVPAGRKFTLKSLDKDTVTIDAMGSPIVVKVGETDVLVGATAKARTDTAATAQAAAPVPQATPPPVARATSTPAAEENRLSKKLKGDLVYLDGKKFSKYDATQLGSKKLLAVYFSAAWCSPCRKFTPKLVEWYNNSPAKDKFDIVFVSSDRSKSEMLDYMKEEGMPWPAVQFDRRDMSGLEKFSGSGIPCLVVLDTEGKVLSHSYEDGTYVGPTKVLKDLERLVTQ